MIGSNAPDSMLRRVLSMVSAVVLVLAAGCGGGAPGKVTLTGSISILGCPTVDASCEAFDAVQQQQPFEVGSPCSGSDLSSGFADMSAGQPVTVKNEKGVLIAAASLAPGVWIKRACQLSFVVRAVPSAKFYVVEAGHRGAQTYTKADLAAKKYRIDLTLGP